MRRPADSRRKLRQRNTPAAREPCVICDRPADWWHHVAGHANAPDVVEPVCRRHADLLDAFLCLAGVKLKHDGPRTAAELAWASIAGLDGLRAARDGVAGLSPVALAVGRLIATLGGGVRGPRPATADARRRQRPQPVATTNDFEAARARAAHDLLAEQPGAAEQHPRLLGLLGQLAADPYALERLGRSCG